MWKILMVQIREKIYSLISRGIFPRIRKNDVREPEVQMNYDQHILNESKKRRKNVVMALIDNKKAYDMVPKAGYYTV